MKGSNIRTGRTGRSKSSAHQRPIKGSARVPSGFQMNRVDNIKKACVPPTTANNRGRKK